MDTLDKINAPHKDYLICITCHIGITVAKSLLKKYLCIRIIDNSVEQGEIVLPEQAQRMKTWITLPRYNPSLPSSSARSRDEARMKVRLARLQLDAQERERQQHLQLKLDVRRLELEMEVDKAVRLRKLELKLQGGAGSTVCLRYATILHVVLVTTFRKVDSYFSVFERIAATLQWPPGVWGLLLQCKLQAKAQEAIAALPLEDSVDYELWAFSSWFLKHIGRDLGNIRASRARRMLSSLERRAYSLINGLLPVM